MTDAERRLWGRLRRRQVWNVQFYRQKPLGPFIVDIYAPIPKLVIEVDGAQHLDANGLAADRVRDRFLKTRELSVLRFDNRQILCELDNVIDNVYRVVGDRLNSVRADI